MVDRHITLYQLDLIDIYRILYPITAEYTLFSRQTTPWATKQVLKNRNYTRYVLKPQCN
jgi:hypothetical protein